MGQGRKKARGAFPILDPLMTGRTIRATSKGPKGRSIGPPCREGGREESNGARCCLQIV